ncbi:MAG: hypothetical protein AABW82_00405 [Nanoarchaeota archaeon]
MNKIKSYVVNRDNWENAKMDMAAVAYDHWDTRRRNVNRVRAYEMETGRSYAQITRNYQKARMAWQKELDRHDVFAPEFETRRYLKMFH